MTTFTHTPAPDPVPAEARQRALRDPGFGKVFTDHMASARWAPEAGWHDLRVRALENYSLHPASAVLHYAQEIFEGLKAFRHADDSIWLFRPEFNARRFVASAERLALPALPPELFVQSVVALVTADQAWVPTGPGERSLYLRPYMFGSEAFLGVRPSAQVDYGVIASPAGAYFTADSGVALWVSETYARAGRGGTGAAKCGGNYASSLAAQVEAQRNGCHQVLYLSEGDRALEESGTMNLFLVTADRHLVTPTLGTILDGATRNSVLELAAEHDLEPVERSVTIDELRTQCADGTVTEMFAAGTAAVITPILEFRGRGYTQAVGGGTPGATTLAIREHIVGIQFGTRPDTRGWLHRVV
ncbi:branched-chain amino acid aminotransferase [Actinokineospora sp. PR83]|uniref:branched-chain amino acid aminotransferase n=1 Tax=Actinokineospora sp. PR83 TaxID=2884908 RepID=UPI001F32B5C3|nr:branched-chain amino acid aminotransferase [Actinokineospora sp. PR83]MCG8915735.1 branched-chain amino acid aminotransferase [Actinokineospora sp. PR83]